MQKNKWSSSIDLLVKHPKKLTLIGLTFGFFGAILLACSVVIIGPEVPPPALTHATINQGYFYSGGVLLAMGYLFQIIDITKEK